MCRVIVGSSIAVSTSIMLFVAWGTGEEGMGRETEVGTSETTDATSKPKLSFQSCLLLLIVKLLERPGSMTTIRFGIA